MFSIKNHFFGVHRTNDLPLLFDINVSADLVRRAKLIITHDTGLMHIAAAFKKPIMSVWGNMVPAFGMYPYYGDNYLKQQADPADIFEVNGLPCRPCSKIGYAKCPRGHFKCMNEIDLQSLIRHVYARLAKR